MRTLNKRDSLPAHGFLVGRCEDTKGEHYCEASCGKCGRCPCEVDVYVGVNHPGYSSLCTDCWWDYRVDLDSIEQARPQAR